MTQVESQATDPIRFGLTWAVGGGSALGAVALAVDELSGAVGNVIRGVAGAAFAWGAAALLAGYFAHSRHWLQAERAAGGRAAPNQHQRACPAGRRDALSAA